ncbi:DEAD/DEAH box helicase [Bacteriovoracaceae bacterium]|nr:DEAD/DEAH box helicase [Bacteriovoracaceae bacterium]|tara:strand:+ start:209219 stop:210541 length:1323 start_codon:yes stop_codon:yes gene_type:complete
MKDFSSFNLLPELASFLKDNNLNTPTPIQEKAIPSMLDKKDVCAVAQTGTGKTFAYALPIVNQLKSNDEDIPMESQVGNPRAIIVVPTRELVTQVMKVFKSISHHAKLRIRNLEGGKDKGRSRRLREEAFDILICAPGRLASAIERKEIGTDLLEWLVLDESDQLLDMGFGKEISKISSKIKNEKYNVALFSATRPEDFFKFTEQTFTERKFTEHFMGDSHGIKTTIETFNVYLGQREKPEMLVTFLEKQAKGSGMIFFNRKEDVSKIGEIIVTRFPKRKVWTLHGAMTKSERKENFDGFVDKGGYLLSSDISARGIDIKDINWVLNYDLPFEAVYYLHRCGRTGRANKKGTVFNFVTSGDRNLIARINEAIIGQNNLNIQTLKSPNSNTSSKTDDTKKTGKKVSKKVAKKHLVNKKAATAKAKKKKSAVKKRTPRYKKK